MTASAVDPSVPDWVIEHPETLAVFEELGTDCACDGESLAYACRERGLTAEKVLIELQRCFNVPLPVGEGLHSLWRRPMAIPHAHPGDVIDVGPLGSTLSQSHTRTLIKTAHLEVVRLVMAAGKQIAEHRAPGEITVQCLEGRIAFTALGRSQELTAGQLLYLPAGEPHSVQCIEDASFLLTIVLHS